MPKNYYIILGIPASSSQKDIKAAYKKLAKEYHPDRYGDGPAPFQNIQEAYSVLGNPERRRDYDERRRHRTTTYSRRSRAEAPRQRSPIAAEPLSPRGGLRAENLSPDHLFQRYRSYDELLDRLFGSLIGRRRF